MELGCGGITFCLPRIELGIGIELSLSTIVAMYVLIEHEYFQNPAGDNAFRVRDK